MFCVWGVKRTTTEKLEFDITLTQTKQYCVPFHY